MKRCTPQYRFVSSERPIEVAIIGGGVAGVTAAFELTRPELRGRYQVTIYQLGWRLGGKGASGRGPNQRIEEHGLHLWMGFYENAFRMMRACYAELGRDRKRCPIADWQDAFVPDHFCGVADLSPTGQWLPWKVNMPPFAGLPGDPAAPPRWTVADYMARTVTLLRTLIEAVQQRTGAAGAATAGGTNSGTPESYVEAMSRFLKFGQLASLTAVVEALNLMEGAIGSAPRQTDNMLLGFHDAVAAAIRSQLERLLEGDDEVRRLWEIADLALAVVRGSIRFGLLTDARGFEAIDDYDCREWLLLNGASPRAVNSAFVRALYDLAFAYEEGDVARPRIAAGQALRGALRAFFTYRGAFFWKMQAGMGDVVFAPFYEVLARRGVRFRFFHRVQRLRVASPQRRAAGAPYIEAIDLDVQAEVKDGDYRPLVDVRGLPSWPAAPDWTQLADGARLRDEGRRFESHWDRGKVRSRTLRVGKDFDLVVLAVGVGAVPHLTEELVAADERWATMVRNLNSVPTQAFQVWMSSDMRSLGWAEDPINISGFVTPFDTWADMTHLAPVEAWPDPPQSIAYFCSVLPDASAEARARPNYPALRHAEVQRNAVCFLDRDIKHLWPKAMGPDGRFRWDLLMSLDKPRVRPGDDASRFASQFWTANVNPTDRYALSLPGTLATRLSPLDETFDNLTIAGDWTDCGFNEGCVEAAAMSGRLAAHAISGSPALADIPGYDHP